MIETWVIIENLTESDNKATRAASWTENCTVNDKQAKKKIKIQQY